METTWGQGVGWLGDILGEGSEMKTDIWGLESCLYLHLLSSFILNLVNGVMGVGFGKLIMASV